MWRSKQNLLHFQNAHTNQTTIFCFWKMTLTPLAYPLLLNIFPNLDLSIDQIKIKMAEVKFNIFATSCSILASKLNLCIQYKTSSLAAMPVNNNICKYTKYTEQNNFTMAIAGKEKVIFKKLNIVKSTICTF